MRTKPKGAPGLKPAQELRRMEGLRVLARIIARHHLEHPELYPAPAGDTGGQAEGAGTDAAAVNAAGVAGRNAERKEADQ